MDKYIQLTQKVVISKYHVYSIQMYIMYAYKTYSRNLQVPMTLKKKDIDWCGEKSKS